VIRTSRGRSEQRLQRPSRTPWRCHRPPPLRRTGMCRWWDPLDRRGQGSSAQQQRMLRSSGSRDVARHTQFGREISTWRGGRIRSRPLDNGGPIQAPSGAGCASNCDPTSRPLLPGARISTREIGTRHRRGTHRVTFRARPCRRRGVHHVGRWHHPGDLRAGRRLRLAPTMVGARHVGPTLCIGTRPVVVVALRQL
jgi:hypothetical protein